MIAAIIAATAIGFAIHQHGGEYTSGAIALITVALVASVVAIIQSKNSSGDRSDGWINLTIGAALALQLIALFILWPVGDDHSQAHRNLANHALYRSLLAMAAMCILIGFTDVKWARHWWFPALLFLHLILGFWTVRASPDPHIDVWMFQQEGAKALLTGHNPYDAGAVNFPDIYHSTLPGKQHVYGDGLVENDRLKFGFPYPPVSLFCSTLGVLLGHDTRYAQAIALTLAGLFIGFARPGRLPKLAAALLMFTPTVWFILGRAWTEPFVVMFLAATLFCACRKLRWALPVALGLLLASKQYLAFAVPLSFLLIDDFSWRSIRSWRQWITTLCGAAIVAGIVTLPLAAWNFRAFWFSTVTVQKWAPFRWDALSYLVWAGFHIDSKYTAWSWLAFVMVVPAMLLSLWKARRGPGGFALAMSLVYLVFIAFNKQAFCNYYFFVIGCLCCAIVLIGTPTNAECDS